MSVAPSISKSATASEPSGNTGVAWNVATPETFNVPFKSTAVAVKSISSVAPIDNTVALDPCINWEASLKHNLFVELSVNPVPSVWVSVVSLSAPKPKTAESDIKVKSSPTCKSAAIPAPPAAISEPVVALVEAVVATIFTCKFSSILIAGVVPTVEPNPINKSSAESSNAI